MERREYERINVETEGAFYIREEGKLVCDFTGVVDNVSEVGLCILVDTNEYDKLDSIIKSGQQISFHAYDENGFSIKEKEGTYYGEAEIVRISSADNILSLGCKIAENSKDFQQYVKGKKTYVYVKALRNNEA